MVSVPHPAFSGPRLIESPKTAGAGLSFLGGAAPKWVPEMQSPSAGSSEARLGAGEGPGLQSFPTGPGAQTACWSEQLGAAYLPLSSCQDAHVCVYFCS